MTALSEARAFLAANPRTKTVKCSFAGSTYGVEVFIGDFIGNEIEATGRPYEAKMLETIATWGLRGTYLDLGANIGNHSLAFARMGADRLVCVEMVPEHAAVLRRNLAASAPCPAVVHEAAISDGGQYAIDKNTANRGSTHLVAGTGTTTTTLDALLGDLDGVVLIKADLERHELAAMRGGVGLLGRNLPVVVLECWGGAAGILEFSPVMRPLGYDVVGRLPGTSPNYVFINRALDAKTATTIKSAMRMVPRW